MVPSDLFIRKIISQYIAFVQLEYCDNCNALLEKDVVVSHVPIFTEKSIILPMKKLKKCEAYQFFHNHSVQQEMCTILEPGIKGVVIENIDGSLSSCFGVLKEGYNQPLDRDGSVVATWGVVDEITINHQQSTIQTCH